MIKYAFSPAIKKQIKGLYVYDNYHGFLALLLDYFCIALAVYFSEKIIYLYPIAILIIGSRQRALATLLHEASHMVLAKNKQLNRLLGGFFAGNLVYQSWHGYRMSHVMKHHRHLGNIEIDPDFQFYVKSGLYIKKSKNSFLYNYLVKPSLFLSSLSSLKYLLVHRLFARKSDTDLIFVLLAQFILFVIGSYCVGFHFYLLYWLVPYLTVFQSITWFIELSEHYPMIGSANRDINATRNRFSHPVEAFLLSMHGENYHLIHHLFPGIPFWKLHQAHTILLQDKTYHYINAGFGGIFFSSNAQASMWSNLINQQNEGCDDV